MSSCLRIAFTFGNISDTKPEEETTAGSADYDGSISAILTFVVTVVMATALSIASVASPQFDDVICLMTLVTYMLIGLSVMSVFAVNRSRFLQSPVMHDSRRRDTLTLAGIAMFFVLASLLDIFHVISYVKCDAVFRACVDRYTYGAYVIVVVYHVVRIAYLGGETFLCISFKRSLFRRTVCTRYAIAFMQAVNVSLWFDAFVHESSDRFNSPLYQDAFASGCRSGGNLSNLTRHELSCMNQNGTMNVLIETKLSPVFLPFLIQFALFVGESFSRWYFHTGTPSARRVVEHTDHEEHTDRGASEMAAITTEHDLRGRSTCEYDDLDPTSDPNNPPGEEYDPDNSAFDNSLSFSFTDSEDSLAEQEEDPFTEETDQASSSSSSHSAIRLSLACLTVFLVANLTVFVAIVCQKYAPGAVPSKYQRLLAYYTCCQSVCMLAAVVAGYLASSKFKVSRRMPFTVFEYLVLLTSCGPFLVRFLSIIAITEFRPIRNINTTSYDNNFPVSSSPPGVYLVAGELVCAVEVYFQVVFNLFAARVKVARQDTCLTATVFRLAVTYLAVANLVAWMLTCSTSVPTEFEVFGWYFSNSDWLSVTKVTLLFPLSTFFRFVSSLQFFKTLQCLLSEEVT